MQNGVDEPRKQLEDTKRHIEELIATARSDFAKATVQFDKAVVQARKFKRTAIVFYLIWGVFLALQIALLVAFHSQACVSQP